ncbi:hypothetical protein E2562_032958 [Oryza meyeriana var. granulata]|uniref:Uncharacterized protein n=1 Tax=Oryza meyeriana var. granulata TaxID=110450 RepID=A0A6G1DA07_9ORYZ|nr:hypothetical protein E2562_032958 [Oryza meyeriana var. granulata]
MASIKRDEEDDGASTNRNTRTTSGATTPEPEPPCLPPPSLAVEYGSRFEFAISSEGRIWVTSVGSGSGHGVLPFLFLSPPPSVPMASSSKRRRRDQQEGSSRCCAKKKKHLYLALDDWSGGYTIYKLDPNDMP